MQAFWANAQGGSDLQQLVPLDRWDIERAYSPQMPPSKMTIYTRQAAFCTAVEDFDASAFRLTKPEATATDPQQRLLMGNCATALSQASTSGTQIGSSTGNFQNAASL